MADLHQNFTTWVTHFLLSQLDFMPCLCWQKVDDTMVVICRSCLVAWKHSIPKAYNQLRWVGPPLSPATQRSDLSSIGLLYAQDSDYSATRHQHFFTAATWVSRLKLSGWRGRSLPTMPEGRLPPPNLIWLIPFERNKTGLDHPDGADIRGVIRKTKWKFKMEFPIKRGPPP